MIVMVIQFSPKFFSNDLDCNMVGIYCAKFNTWKRVGHFPYSFRFSYRHGVLATNTLHWMVYQNPDVATLPLITVFDLVTENYFEIFMA